MKVVKNKGVEGKVIVCTGAAGVLCSSMTEDMLRHGAKVAVLDLRGDVAKTFCAKLAKKGLTQTLAIEANVLDRASLEAACKTVLKKWRRIDVLINGAGGNHPKGTTPAEQMTKDTKLEDTFFGLTPEGFEFVNRLNLVGTILPCQVFCKEMLKRGGAVLNFCSMAAYQPLTKVAAYGAAKAGIMNFTSFLATHLAPMGIRVNAIAPGFFNTELSKFIPAHEFEYINNQMPLGRFGEPIEVGALAVFLASPAAAQITGTVQVIDGGYMLRC